MQPLVPLVFHNLPSLYPPSFRFFILVYFYTVGSVDCIRSLHNGQDKQHQENESNQSRYTQEAARSSQCSHKFVQIVVTVESVGDNLCWSCGEEGRESVVAAARSLETLEEALFSSFTHVSRYLAIPALSTKGSFNSCVCVCTCTQAETLTLCGRTTIYGYGLLWSVSDAN